MTDILSHQRAPSAPAFVAIARNRLLAAMAPRDYALLAPYLADVLLERGAMLQDMGERSGYVYFPHTGTVGLLCATPQQQLVETASIGREGAVGMPFGHAAALGQRYRAMVQMPGTAARLSAARFAEAVAESETLRDLVAAQYALLLRQTQQNVVCGALHVVRARICRFLAHARDRCGSDTLPLTQEGIAQALGVQRTTVTLVLGTLQEEGAIRTMRGRILVRDAAGIAAQACACYPLVRDLGNELTAAPSLAMG